MKRQYFKPYNTFQLYRLTGEKSIRGRYFAKNSIVCIHDNITSFGSTSDLYVCEKLPSNYHGNDPTLQVFAFNEYSLTWERMTIHNEISRKMWAAFVKGGRKKPSEKFASSSDIEGMMRHDARHKKSSGSRINTYQINNPVQYNQVTASAYWANLDDAHSGKASVIGSGPVDWEYYE